MDEKEQNKKEESKKPTQDPEQQDDQPKENQGLQRNASVDSSETPKSGSTTDSPKSDPSANPTITSGSSLETEENFSAEETGGGLPSDKKGKAGDSGLVTTSDPSNESNSGKNAESSVASFPTNGSFKTTPSTSTGSPDSEVPDKDKTPSSTDQNDPQVLNEVVPPPAGNNPPDNPPEDAIEMQEVNKPTPPVANPPSKGGVPPQPAGSNPAPNVPVEDDIDRVWWGNGWDCGCVFFVSILLFAFTFGALSPAIHILFNSQVVANGTNATYSNETLDNETYANATSQFFTTGQYDVSLSNRT